MTTNNAQDRQVWVPPRGGQSLTPHYDPDCRGLANATEVIGPKPRSIYPDDTPDCTWCTGEETTPGERSPSLRELVDRGELRTDGGTSTSGRERRHCSTCGRETEVHRTRGNNGIIEFCPGCFFPYDFGSGGVA